jgi:methyltransferase (TIGR00027 family)
MRTDHPSLTASIVAAMRAIYTEMPEPYRLAADPLAVELVPSLFALPVRALRHAPSAAGAVHRWLGRATLGISYHVQLRTRAIDDAVREAVRRGVTQLVVLGAGLDSRAMRMNELAGVRAYEVDHPSSQRYKIKRLARTAAPPKTRSIERVAVDFERDRLDEALSASGFRSTEPAIWIWEGVTIYLTREAIAGTLRFVAALSAPGSRLAVTYGLALDEELPSWILRLADHVLRAFGEPVRTPLTPGVVDALLSGAGFSQLSDDSTQDWAARYWPWQRGVRAIERLVIAERRP